MSWLLRRLTERTTYDGAVLIGCGIVMIIAPLNLVAYGMIAYGAWTLIESE